MKKRPQSIEQVKKMHELELMQLYGVEGVGITERDGIEGIVLYVSDPQIKKTQAIPETLGGFPVFIHVTGELSAL